ncbi:MAG: DUF2029 domain-containing protein [Bacteroidota bacterium]|nr:DUF2029 domain-containing protein [Bacteroidota bacterium]
MNDRSVFSERDFLFRAFSGRRGALFAALLSVLFLYFGCYKAIVHPAGDFANYYTASRLALSGGAGSLTLYDHFWFQNEIDKYFHNTLGSFIPFPPSTVLLLMPLAWLSPHAARISFVIVNMLLTAGIILMLGRITKLPLRLVAVLVLLSGISLWSNVREGQMYLLLVFDIAAALLLEQRGNYFSAGVLFGVMLPIKYITLLFVVYFLFRKNFTLFRGAVIAVIVVFAAGVFFTSVKLNEYYLAAILPQHLAGNIQNPFAANFQSFHSLLNRLFVPNETLNPHPLASMQWLASWLTTAFPFFFLGMIISAIRSVSFSDDSEEISYVVSLLVTFGLATSPASASYHLFLLVIPIVLISAIAMRGELEFIQRRMASLVVLFAATNFLPLYKLYRFDGDSIFTLLAYIRLGLLTAFFLLLLPPQIWRTSFFRRASVGAVALSVLVILVRSQQTVSKDGAVWAGFDGLIIKHPALDGNSVFYLRESPAGFVAMKNRTLTNDDPPMPRRISRDSMWTAFDSTIGFSRQIFLRNNRTGAAEQLTHAGDRNYEPVWTDDDRRLYFLSDRGRGIDCTTIFYLPIDRREFP